MKVLAMRDAKAGLSATLDEAQHDRVLITRNGKPSAIVIGVEGREFEDVLLMSNPRFWEMIEASRGNPRTYSMAEVRKYFAVKDSHGTRPGPRQRRTENKSPPSQASKPKGTQPRPNSPTSATGRRARGSR
jgi:prevent-host-death family protein